MIHINFYYSKEVTEDTFNDMISYTQYLCDDSPIQPLRLPGSSLEEHKQPQSEPSKKMRIEKRQEELNLLHEKYSSDYHFDEMIQTLNAIRYQLKDALTHPKPIDLHIDALRDTDRNLGEVMLQVATAR